MPPYRADFLKRKLKPKKGSKSLDNQNNELSTEDELIHDGDGVPADENDATDSEHEEVPSDKEEDEVLFHDSDDSAPEAGEGVDHDSDESSELTDSEADDSDDSEEASADSEEESTDSGAECSTTISESSQSVSKKDTPKVITKIKGVSRKKQDTKIADSKQMTVMKTRKNIRKTSETNSKHNEPQKSKAKILGNEDQKLKVSTSIDDLEKKVQETILTSQPVQQKDEYESGDSSDEEDCINTRGQVPASWYDDYPHLGYDLEGRKVLKSNTGDHIDMFLRQCEDPDFWRTVKDPKTGQNIILSKEDLQLISRIRGSQIPNADHDEYKPWVEWFSREVMATPIRGFPDHKKSFLPSKSEQLQISKIVHKLKCGWMKTRKQLAEERRAKKIKHYYDLWGSTTGDEASRGIHRHIPAPRRPLPGHAESYRPPPEYLLDAKEMKEWNSLSETPWKRKYTFLPTRHDALRHVAAYPRFIRERFLRCLDLYLAPRAIKMRLTITPEQLVPKLPSPRELQPFPTTQCLVYRGHTDIVRCCHFEPTGLYVVSGSDDGTVKVWETSTGRCLRTIELGGEVTRVAWTPAKGLSLIAATVGTRLLLLNPGAGIGAHKVATTTDELLATPPKDVGEKQDGKSSAAARWELISPGCADWKLGIRMTVNLATLNPLTCVAWHAKGDYIVTTARQSGARAVVVHQVSRRRSQLPLSNPRGLVQCAAFHPQKPHLFVATQRCVRIYDLVAQRQLRKLEAGVQWISSIVVHPRGDHLVVGSYDRKTVWFDLELSARPFRTLRLHGKAVRSVALHARYPLMGTGGDDPKAIVTHAGVPTDLLQSPLLVPLKTLPTPSVGDLSVLDLSFHPTQPWLLAATADSTLVLFT